MSLSRLVRYGLVVCYTLSASGFIAAAQLGDIRIDSHRGKILDARISLIGALQEDSPFLFRQASVEAYQQHQVEYSKLHTRLLIDPVLSGNPPYIAISSIGAVNRKEFTVVLENLSANPVQFKQYKITLLPPPNIVPLPKKNRIISPAEVLWQLLTLLGPQRGLTRAQAMAELNYLRDGGLSSAGGQHLIFHLHENKISQELISGFKKFLTAEERQLFNQALGQGASAAITKTLLTPAGQSILSRLLDEGIASAAQWDSDSEQTVSADMPGKLQALKNRIVEIESVEKFKTETMTAVMKPAAQAKLPSARPWLLSRRTWVMVASVWAVFFLLALFRLVRHP